MSLKVAIVGTAPGWERAPFDDPSWELWGLNDGYALFREGARISRWFELHGDTPLTRARRPPDHFDRIREMRVPVYYLHGDPPTTSAIRLDTDALAAVWRDYFTCTFAYQIALALSEGATDIAMYGSPLMGAREVVVERPCVAAWLGFAAGRGVSVSVVHEKTTGLLAHPYRYAETDVPERTMTFLAVLSIYREAYQWLDVEGQRLESL